MKIFKLAILLGICFSLCACATGKTAERPVTLPLEGQNGIYTISDYEDSYSDELSADNGSHPIMILDGTTVSIDLDSDGSEESVCVNVNNRVSFKVNDIEYGDKDGDGSLNLTYYIKILHDSEAPSSGEIFSKLVYAD